MKPCPKNNENKKKEMKKKYEHICREVEARPPKDAGLPWPSRSTSPNPFFLLLLWSSSCLFVCLSRVFSKVPPTTETKKRERDGKWMRDTRERERGRTIKIGNGCERERGRTRKTGRGRKRKTREGFLSFFFNNDSCLFFYFWEWENLSANVLKFF